MVDFLLATHGEFAKGLCDSLFMIFGSKDNIHVLCAYTDGNMDISKQVKQYIDKTDEQHELIVLTDIFGGSVNNEFMKYIGHKGFYLVAGVSLPLLLGLVVSQEEDTKKRISQVLEGAGDFVYNCNNVSNIEGSSDTF